MKLFDPTVPPVPRTLTLAPRPRDLRGLRVGFVENRKFNSDTLLLKLGERLARDYGMTVTQMARKLSPSHGVGEEGIDAVRRVCDVVVSGIGD